ncbi:hypothetical protein GCM10012288_14930 [Malaciobacter pacificus]|uniref:Uncharacterized protein n=1 Tax=Malaciobacter pacificus TaxID=1080223 RepID=A0A5C2HFD9_9BACT|nr:hypothetical protein [Malaciobacter pacificus]QEP35554.1 hypothetical protein APAC_2501 [Malaciobacter pacificus]GGD41734.1 hypothetical protein GCM10012288_14930 [Malaciobacter pacificus]
MKLQNILKKIINFINLDFNDIPNSDLENLKSKKLLMIEYNHINEILKNKQSSRNKLSYFFITGIFLVLFTVLEKISTIEFNQGIITLFLVFFLSFVLSDLYHSHIIIKKKRIIVKKIQELN